MNRANAALDLAALGSTVRSDDIRKICMEGSVQRVCTICVAPTYTLQCAYRFPRVCTVIGFPHGTSTIQQKTNEAIQAVALGAAELDIVTNYAQYLSGNRYVIEQELSRIIQSIPEHITVKAILEACYFPDHELNEVSRLCADVGVDFIKTSTGFGEHGATVHDVNIMLDAVAGTPTEVKASGGIKTYEDAIRFLDLGCTRLGASHTFKE